ncbi:DUF305 domain-containing protein [Nocardioides sp.]|uniref:DUF305 domain-containing protein n=1 Tax=Nocardioides sp. TaxID=35761 RepID=UPI002736D657|nr:DUF305 domain-containing protein [Nocardioides sp.]MDP3891788.1 DUF305 domain-containing protein [Nocardioides sp.]
MKTRHALLTTALAAALTLGACGADTSTDDPGSTDGPTDRTAAEAHNEADVAFATEMIPHHGQALVMVDMAEGRASDPDFAALLEDIEAAQAPEIELMQGWLEAWGEPVPDARPGHGGMDHGGMDSMPGMMSADELDDLEAARDARFQDMWLQMMIRHHEGAVEMARVEQAEGRFGEAITLAEEIERAQLEEIALMESMLSR